MSKVPRYKVIHNPNNLILPFEVWKAGEDVIEVHGTHHKVTVPYFGKVKSFRKHESARGYIEYQQAVRQFKEEG